MPCNRWINYLIACKDVIHAAIFAFAAVCTAPISLLASPGSCNSMVPKSIAKAPGNLTAICAGSVPRLAMKTSTPCNTATKLGTAAARMGFGVDIKGSLTVWNKVRCHSVTECGDGCGELWTEGGFKILI